MNFLRRFFLIPAVLAVVFFTGLLKAQEASPTPFRRLDIRVAEDPGWGVRLQDVKKVLDAAGNELYQNFSGRKLDPIIVWPSGGPVTLYARGQKGEYQVRLATGNTYWAQYTFQFAHELCHILCHYDNDPNPQKWFEESLCELASLYVLRRSSETWKTNPPYANWKSYATALGNYADERINASRLPIEKTLADWYRDNADALSRSATDRDRNNIVALQLLPLFEKSPESWETITWLNVEKLDSNYDFRRYLEAWHRNSPPKHREFIRKIARQFGIEIPEDVSNKEGSDFDRKSDGFLQNWREQAGKIFGQLNAEGALEVFLD